MKIYLPLLNEGTEVWRPVEAEPVGENLYRIVQPQPDDEEWPVVSGDIVKCETRNFASGEVWLTAKLP